MSDKFSYSCNSTVNSDILDSIKSNEKIVSLSLNIKASHAGKVNGNYVFYTPRSMRQGSTTLIEPFKKHLQKLHRGDAVGVINDAYYIDYSENYSEEVKSISTRIETAQNQIELVKAVKELVKHSDYKNTTYKGLGVLTVSAELFDSTLINDLTTGDNKGKVSIGGNATRVYCSVCGELFGNEHKHKRGSTYDSETCFAIYDNMFLDHIGFVPDPADTSTETSIIQDSLDNEESVVTIDNFKIQDNKQGYLMNIEQLKQFASDAEGLVNLDIFSNLQEVQKEFLKDNLKEGMKTTRKSAYLFTEDKLLPLTSKESVAVASLLVDQLEDSAEKTMLADLIKVKKEVYFTKDEDVSAYVTSLNLQTQEEEETKKEDEQEASTVDEAADTSTVESANSTAHTLSKEDYETLIAKAVETAIEKFVEKQATTKVEDSISYELLINTNKQLSTDIAALDAANIELTNKYKAVIISQILASQGRQNDEQYAEILSTRELSSLTDTFNDLEYLSKTKTVDTNTATVVQDNKTPLEVEENTVSSIQDSQEIEELEKTDLEDSLKNLKNEDTKTKEANTADDELQVLKEKGLAAYLKLKKGK